MKHDCDGSVGSATTGDDAGSESNTPDSGEAREASRITTAGKRASNPKATSRLPPSSWRSVAR